MNWRIKQLSQNLRQFSMKSSRKSRNAWTRQCNQHWFWWQKSNMQILHITPWQSGCSRNNTHFLRIVAANQLLQPWCKIKLPRNIWLSLQKVPWKNPWFHTKVVRKSRGFSILKWKLQQAVALLPWRLPCPTFFVYYRLRPNHSV